MVGGEAPGYHARRDRYVVGDTSAVPRMPWKRKDVSIVPRRLGVAKAVSNMKTSS